MFHRAVEFDTTNHGTARARCKDDAMAVAHVVQGAAGLRQLRYISTRDIEDHPAAPVGGINLAVVVADDTNYILQWGSGGVCGDGAVRRNAQYSRAATPDDEAVDRDQDVVVLIHPDASRPVQSGRESGHDALRGDLAHRAACKVGHVEIAARIEIRAIGRTKARRKNGYFTLGRYAQDLVPAGTRHRAGTA